MAVLQGCLATGQIAGLWLMFFIIICTPSSGLAQPAESCSAPYRVVWPLESPIWSLCWLPPDKSSGISGSGLELYDVEYKGKRVLARAHLPVLNVRYDPGGCGGRYLSYRDWQNELSAFLAENELSSGYAEPSIPPRTVLEHPGTDEGSFKGVAVEKRSDRLILTTQMTAGWYRYIQKWVFWPDGTIEPRLGFSYVNDPCVTKSHNHHAYWRFDFDIQDSTNDAVERFSMRIAEKAIQRETAVGGPALAMFGNMLALGWTGTDPSHRINVAVSSDGLIYSSKVTLAETSIDGPALTSGGEQLVLGWTGTDPQHRINVSSSTDAKTFGNKTTLQETTWHRPALVYGHNRFYIAWTGTDSRKSLNIMSSSDGTNFSNKITLRETSDSAPQLAFVDGKLYLLWRGVDTNQSLNILESSDGQIFSPKSTLTESSSFSPDLTKTSQWMLFWTGRDPHHRLNGMVGDNISQFFGKTSFIDASGASPAIELFRAAIYLAWTGIDPAHRLNVGRLTAGWHSVGEVSTHRQQEAGQGWIIKDKSTGRGYVISPGLDDGQADAWSVNDNWALRYQPNELDDGGRREGEFGDAVHLNDYINGESIEGQNVVVWYRAGTRHSGGNDSRLVGPTLKPIGSW